MKNLLLALLFCCAAAAQTESTVHVVASDPTGAVCDTANLTTPPLLLWVRNLYICDVTGHRALLPTSGGGPTGATGPSGPAGGGAAASSQLTDFAATASVGNTVATVSAACASASCYVHFGNTALAISASCAVTLSGSGTGTLYWWVDSSAGLSVGYNSALTVSASGCPSIPSTTAMPTTNNTSAVGSWHVTSGTLDGGGYGKVASTYGQGKSVAGSNGVLVAETAGTYTVSPDLTVIPQTFFGTAPPGSISGNMPGAFFNDTTNHHLYRCDAPGGTAAPACISVTAGGWTQVDGGGGGGISSVTETEQYFWGKDIGGQCYPTPGMSAVAWTGGLNCSTNGGRTSVLIPNGATGSVTISRFMSATQSGALTMSMILQNSQGGSGTVVFTIDHYCAAIGDNTTSPTYVGSQTLTITIPTDVTGTNLGIKDLTLDQTGCAAGDMHWLRLTQATGTYPNGLDWFGTIIRQIIH